MRQLLLISWLLSISILIYSQDTRRDKADSLYNNYSYDKSIRKYEPVKDKDIHIKRNLAVSYFNVGDYLKSKEYWKQVVEDEKHVAEDLYNYAAVLAINEEYDESELWMQKYYQLNKQDGRAKSRLKNKDFYKALQENKGVFSIRNLKINTKQQDFGTSYYLGDVVYASSRERKARIIKRLWNWNRLPFLDIYYGKSDSSLQLKSIKKFKGKVNKRYHEGPATFNKTGDFMVYTSNNYKDKSSDDIVKLELFSAEKKKNSNKWKKAEPFSFNSKEYSVGHASLTAGGDTMYFASDMPGGIGKTDIYVTYRKSDGSWTEPKNLGETINTEGDEMFPFIHSSGTLFFASNGHPGLGGLDVFVSRPVNGGYSKPENLKVPINSSYDDFAFILDDKQNSGYFSSNRPGGKGDDDIYSFRMMKPLKYKRILRGKSLDNNDVILAGTSVYLLSESGDTLARTVTGDDGKYEFEVEDNRSYKLVGTKSTYKDGVETFAVDKEVTEVDVVLSKAPKFLLYVYVTDSRTGNPIDGVSVNVSDQVSQNIDNMYTSAKGDAHKKLLDKKMQDNLKFKFKLNKSGYMPKETTWHSVVDHEGAYEVRISMDEMVNLPIIYFDYNKSNIRRDASNDLDKVVDVMNRYPEMVVELSSHTDCRGTARYNRGLSDRRAKSSANYIKKRLNNNPERIYGKGYGESRLVNNCECEGSEKCSCSEAEHQLNRRTEFVIIKLK